MEIRSISHVSPHCFDLFDWTCTDRCLSVGLKHDLVANSDWLPRKIAIRQVLRRACIKLGYLSLPDADKYTITIIDAEDDQEVLDIDGSQDICEQVPFTPRQLRIPAQECTPYVSTDDSLTQSNVFRNASVRC